MMEMETHTEKPNKSNIHVVSESFVSWDFQAGKLVEFSNERFQFYSAHLELSALRFAVVVSSVSDGALIFIFVSIG